MDTAIHLWAVKPVTGREDTILKNYPLYCPKYKVKFLIVAKDLQVTVIKELRTIDAELMNKENHKFGLPCSLYSQR